MPRNISDSRAAVEPPRQNFWFTASDLQLRLEGPLGQANNAFFRLPWLETQVALPPAEYALLAALAQKSLEAEAVPDEAFLSAQELGEILRRHVRRNGPAKHHGIDAVKMKRNAVRTVYRLRRRLSGLPVGEALRMNGVIQSSRDFAHLLIARNQYDGYRLSISPAALELDIISRQAPDYAFSDFGLRLSLIGRFGKAGRARFETPSSSETVSLPAAEWAVLAMLVSQAQLWPPRSTDAFLSSAVLAERLDHAGVGNENYSQNVIRTVKRLRNRLGELELGTALDLEPGNQIDPRGEFTRLLILHSRHHSGYRINVSPTALAIQLHTREM